MGRMQCARMTINKNDVTTWKKWQEKKQREEEAKGKKMQQCKLENTEQQCNEQWSHKR